MHRYIHIRMYIHIHIYGYINVGMYNSVVVMVISNYTFLSDTNLFVLSFFAYRNFIDS